MRSYRDLEVWRWAMELTVELYRVTGRFPAEERFGLAAQIRSSAVSLVSGIAEGAGRSTPGEHRNLLSVASGSAAELATQLTLAGELSYVPPETATQLLNRLTSIHRMLYRLIESLK